MAGNVAPNIIDSGLVLYLDAANTKSYPTTGTTWTDLSKNINNSILTNGPIFNSSNIGNIIFDGIDDYCLTPLTGNPTYFSFECVVKFNSLLGIQVVVGKFTGVGQDYWLGLSSGNFVFSTNGSILNSNLSANSNNIYIITCILSLTSKDIYVNGVLTNSASPTTSSPNGNLVLADFGLFGLYPASINLYSFKFYDRALTATEVLQNYNSTKARFGI